MMPMGYNTIVETLRGPDFQCINPWKRHVVLQAADAIERLLDMVDAMIEDAVESEERDAATSL